jgi:hypothetical protein
VIGLRVETPHLDHSVASFIGHFALSLSLPAF